MNSAAIGIQFAEVSGASDPDRNIARGNEVYDNGVAGPTGEGIVMCGDDNLAELNYVHDNQADGVLVYDDPGVCDSIDAIVRFNWIVGNGGGSVVVQASNCCINCKCMTVNH